MLIALLVVVTAAAIGFSNARQARQALENYSQRLSRNIVDGLHRAGRAQVGLLASAARISLLQSDYASLKTIVEDLTQRDSRIVGAAILESADKIIATAGLAIPSRLRAEAVRVEAIQSRTALAGQQAIVFSMPVSYRARRLCTLILAYSLRHLEAALTKVRRTNQRIVSGNLRSIALVGAGAGLVGVVLAVLFGTTISGPVGVLASQARRIAAGELGGRVSVKSRDELGQLADTFNYMSQQVSELMARERDVAAVQREVELARTIQRSLIPRAPTVEARGIAIESFFEPATHCGGDWWHYFALPNDTSLITIGDVTGHGVPAAMITALVQGAAASIVGTRGSSIDLSELLAMLNEVVLDVGRKQYLMTCFVTLYEPRQSRLSFANAGHTIPYLVRVDGTVESLRAKGTPLGFQPRTRFAAKQMELTVGDLLVWYTDGVVELQNAQDTELGDARFRQLFVEQHSRPLPELRSDVVAGLRRYSAGRPAGDDLTLLIGRIAA